MSDEARRSARAWGALGSEQLHVDLDEAERCYRNALDLDPGLAWVWFDLGLVHKWRKEWAECLSSNVRSLELTRPEPGGGPGGEPDPAYWNAGIAATALHDWPMARWAWTGYGITMPDGDGPIDGTFGRAVVRLPVGETVWGRRIDPARMVIESVPLPDSERRCGDVILHDGAPEGRRLSGGIDYPVFNELVRWRASDVPTVQIDLDGDVGEAVRGLQERLEAVGVTAENWTTSIEINCLACSLGTLDLDRPAEHQHDHSPGRPPEVTRLGCSGDPATVDAIARSWAALAQVPVIGIEAVG